MSECGDSFEEIGLMQPGLSGSASINEQESNNLNNSTMSNSKMSNSTNQMNTAQLKELKFELTGKIRDEIIGNLSELTKLLSGLAVEPDARETMRKANGDLMVALLNLPVKADGRLRCSESLGQSSDDRPNHQPSDRSIEVVFELNSDLRSRIVDTLMTNHNVALLLGADSVENECKLKLIVRNNEMICELVKLKSRTVAISSDSLSNNTLSKGDHRIDQAAKASGSQTISRSVATNEAKNDDELNSSERPDRNQDPALQQQKLVEHPVTGQAASSPTVEEVAILKEELQKLKIRTAGELDDLKQKLAESKRLDVCRNEITFTTTLSAYDYSSDKKSIKEMESEVFHFRGIPWYLCVGPWKEDGLDYMSLHLKTNGIIDKDWSTVKSGEDRNFEKPDSFAGSHKFGWNKFATVSQLARFAISKDIKIRVHLSTESLQTVQD